MATRMGAPGVRIELHDRSGYSLVETPNAVAAVVGFAPKGELNKIQLLTNTAEQDTYFGLGFNNSRYNQGMYAARAVINAGGHVEFVRPYGEEIDKTSDRKRDLKTDAYVVAFDPTAGNNQNTGNNDSIKVEYFAATRYKTDGAARYGVTRKINNVAETITNGSNVNFNVDAAEDYSDPKNWHTVENPSGVARGGSDMVMFALMNADPSSANRAYTSYKVSLYNDDGRTTGELVIDSATKVGFTIDDVVYGVADGVFKDIYTFRVTNVVEKTVSLKAADDATVAAVRSGYCPKTLVYGEGDVAVENGYDYLTVKTAVTGRGAKTFGSLFIDNDTFTGIKAAISGTVLEFVGQSGETVYVRLDTKGSFDTTMAVASEDGKTLTFGAIEKQLAAILVGDKLQITKDNANATTLTVTGIVYNNDDTGTVTVVAETDASPLDGQTVTVNNFAYNWVDSLDTLSVTVGEDTTLEKFVGDLLEAIGGSELGYGKSPVLGDIAGVDSDDKHVLKMVAGAASEFIPGDLVAITRGTADREQVKEGEITFDGKNILFVGKVKSVDPISSTVTLTDVVKDADAKIINNDEDSNPALVTYQLVNLTQTSKTAFAAVDSLDVISNDEDITVITSPVWELKTPGADGATADEDTQPVYALAELTVTSNSMNKVAVGDTVKLTVGDVPVETSVTAVNKTGDQVSDFTIKPDYKANGTHEHGTGDTGAGDTAPDIAVAGKVHVSAKDVVEETADIYLVGNFDTSVPVKRQSDESMYKANLKAVNVTYAPAGDSQIVERSDKVLTDSSIGGTFVGLGLARIQYMDVNFSGDTVRVYDLTDDGEAVARLYLSVAYMYNGIRYEFDGTVIPYVYNDMQLYIGDTAETELEGSGVYFVLNDSGVMELFREDNSYDLSATVTGEGETGVVPCSTTTCPAFNVNDPAIVNDAVWTYDPAANMSTSTLSNAFNLFLDKDKSDVTFFVGAGLGVNNFGLKGYETLNTQLMQAILNICELRKDCFALFDGVADSRIAQTLKLDSPASRFGSTLGRWGAIYDARPIFFDSLVTKMNVELAPSVAMASLITANRKGSIWWFPPSGEDTGMIPGAWCRKVKYERKFNIPEDTESDIAKLCDIHVNPFRTNKKGIYAYGDFTMQMEDTAFNAIGVTMLVAGIHKMYYNYLDSRVFRINTAALRSQITTDLQGQLDKIVGENPAGLEPGSHVICDDTNNPPEVIEAHKLMVDLMLYPTTSTRYIFLRTNVLSRANGNTITTELSTGNR